MKPSRVLAVLCVLLPLTLLAQSQSKSKPDTDSEMPVPEYQHASPSAYEAFRDLKYGIRIHWGIYTLAHAKTPSARGGESWMFLPLSHQEKQAYQQLYQTWNPTGFDAEEWARLFAENGMKMFAITTKHHEGFSLFDTKTRVHRRVNWAAPGGPVLEDCDLAYSVMETPFHRDIIKELCDAGHKHGLAIDLYFSHTDWYDADFRPYGRDPVYVPDTEAFHWGGNKTRETEHAKLENVEFTAPPPTAAEEQRMMLRHRQQLSELLGNYGKIDLVCLDIGLGNRVWPEMRETMLALRKLQPDVMFRNRGIGAYGDYETPERVIPGTPNQGQLPWFVIYPLASNFDYDPNPANYKGGEWIIRSLVDSVAKGGNFMVGVGPGPDGKFHPQAVENIQTAGAWLKTNGEGIYATRPREGDLWHEGNEVRYTQSKDHRTIFAFTMHWPGEKLILKTVQPKAASPIQLLGYPKPLVWTYSEGIGATIQLPPELRDDPGQKGFFIRCFKIQPQL